MSKWREVKLSDVCISITDGDHQPPPKTDSGIPFITISNIDPALNVIDFSGCSFVPEDYYYSLADSRKAQIGDVLYSAVGSFGIPVLIGSNDPFVFQRHIAILRPGEELDPRFLAYTMKSDEFFRWADNVAVGAAQRTVTLNQLRNKTIRIPSLETQDKIAGVLASYDQLIENNRKQIRLLEEAAQRLYKEWFIDLKFPGHDFTSIDPDTELPEGWKTGQLSEIAEIVFGQSPKSDFYNNIGKGIPFHQGVKGYSERFVVNEVYTSQWKKEAKPGSILFSVRAPVGSINLTKARIAIGRGLAAINSKYHTQSFLLYLLKEKFYKKDLMGNGSIYASINSDTLKTIECIIPDIRVIELFEKHVSCIDSEIWTRDEEICRLQEARDRLLPKLMSGEIEVS